MAKAKTAYVCTECGASALQWFGTCPSCAAVGTLSETAVEKGASHRYAAEATKAVTLEAIDRLAEATADYQRAIHLRPTPSRTSISATYCERWGD